MERHNYIGRERRQRVAERIVMAAWLLAILAVLTVTARALGL